MSNIFWLILLLAKVEKKKNSGSLSPQSFQQFVQNANHVHIKKFVPWENVHVYLYKLTMSRLHLERVEKFV